MTLMEYGLLLSVGEMFHSAYSENGYFLRNVSLEFEEHAECMYEDSLIYPRGFRTLYDTSYVFCTLRFYSSVSKAPNKQ